VTNGELAHAPSPTDRLLALFHGHRLSPAQRRIAQYLLDHMPDAAFLSSVDVAERVGVSQPSVTRFAVALGFPGYPGLREALRPIALSPGGGAGGASGSRNEVAGNGLQLAVDAEIRNLEALRDLLGDVHKLPALGRDLAGSVPLTVLGPRISAPLAEYFVYCAKRIHPDVRLAAGSASAVADALLQSREAGGTWVLAFAMPRYAVELVTALRKARQLGLRTAAVADAPMVPFADEVDVLLPAGVTARLVFDSYAAPMVLTTAILQAIADAQPERTQRRLDAHERLTDQLAVFTAR
jgi:DNA-binding MurR/RpiR family transcriptional regulator